MRKMKDSGLSWIDEIPYTWKTARVKYLFSSNKGLPITKENLIENGLPVISYGQIHSKSNSGVNISEELLRFVDFSYHSLYPRSQVFNGSFVFADTSEDLDGCGNCVYKRDDNLLFAGYHSIVLISKATTDNRFLAYLFKTDAWRKQIRELVSRVKVFSISQSALLNASIILPPLDEQKRIADFLDKECKKIDGLKADIQLQIDTLEQYKRSVITEAVTHGLNPNVPVKDSGIDWVGKIPNTWAVVKGKYIFTQRNNRGNNIALQLLSPTQKYGVVPQEMYEELSGMNAVKLNDNANYALLKTIHKGDYCISLRSFQGGFEYSEYEGVVSPAYQVFYPIANVDRCYYKYLFKEKRFIEVMNSYSMSLRDGKNIAFDDFGNTFIPVPPLDEQKEIADYLDKKCAEIEQTIADKKAQLDTLDDYKKSLIYEYVTGKKEAA